jgi:hypothetical protein
MKLDSRGLAVTTDSDGAVDAIDHFADQLLGMGPDLEAILDDAAAYPDCAIIQAYAASMYVYAQLRSEAAKAAPLLDLARQHFDRLTERERLFVEGVAAGCQGDFERAISIQEQIARRWSRDVVAAKLAEFHFFQTGESARQLAHAKHRRAQRRQQSSPVDVRLRAGVVRTPGGVGDGRARRAAA